MSSYETLNVCIIWVQPVVLVMEGLMQCHRGELGEKFLLNEIVLYQLQQHFSCIEKL